MARSQCRSLLLTAAVATLGVVALTLWIATRVQETRESAEGTRIGIPVASTTPESPGVTGDAGSDSPAWNDASLDTQRIVATPRAAERPKYTPPAPVDFWLRVVDGDTRAAIAGVEVELTAETPLPSIPGDPVRNVARENSDAEGLLRFDYRTGWSTNASLNVEGYQIGFCRIDDRHSEPANALTVRLSRSASLEIQFVGDRLRAMAASVHVRNNRRRGEWFQSANREGVCRVDGLPPRVVLCVGASDSGSRSFRRLTCDVVLAPGEHRALVFDLNQGAVVRGRAILANGAEAARHEVALVRAQPSDRGSTRCLGDESIELDFGQSTTTDDGGSFELAGVEPGSWWIAVAREPEAPLFPPALARWIEVTEPDEEVEVDLRITQPPRIEGRVISPSGNGLYTWVESTGRDRNCTVKCATDPEGSFVLEPLVDGVQRLRARGTAGMGDSEWVEAEPGAREVVLRLTMGASIRGTIVDPTGAAIDRAQVAVISQGDFGWTPGGDANPNFAISGLSAGRYVVRATASGGRIAISEPIVLSSGATVDGTTLSLERSANLEVVAPVREPATILVLDRDAVVAEPAVGVERTIFSVPPRVLEVRAVCRGEILARRTISPAAGERLTVDLSGE